MRVSSIINEANRIREDYGERPSFKDICRSEGILMLQSPMGTEECSLKGFIVRMVGKIAITVNSDISDELKDIINWHEVAHYFLHVRTGLMESVNDSSLYDRASESELEANLLAAELQLNDDDVYEALRENGDFYAAAESLCVPPDLLSFKLNMMEHKGYNIPHADFGARGDYLARFNDRRQY
ncbi:MAG: ImmA/IrrE family metallo-endopeptidase [Eubacteriales bacterium]|nr:ImmA/IrrE family metallo-endopeptidase [Eubacteriales bacterium]